MEGILFALYNICKTLEESSLIINDIHVSGGFVHSELWLQLLADVFGKKIVLIRAEDASAQGAAYLAMKKLGLIQDYASLMPGSVKTFLPNTHYHSTYSEKVFPIFKNLSNNLKLDMAILHELKISLQDDHAK